MNRLRILSGAALLAMCAAGLSGCANDASSLSDALSQAASAGTDVVASAQEQASAGNVAAGFARFAGGPPPGGFRGGPPELTDEQRQAIEALRAQLEAGEIDEATFREQLHEIIGDPPGGAPVDPLNLTDEQRTQADAIFDQLHTDIKALRDDADAQIRALLTEEQQAAFDELLAARQERMGPLGPPGPHAGPAGLNAAAPGFTGRGPGPHGPGGPPPGGAFGPPGFGPPPIRANGDGVSPTDRLAEKLSLTDEQKAAVQTIFDTTETAIQARHDQAKADFRAILTEEQQATLDQLEADRAAHEAEETAAN